MRELTRGALEPFSEAQQLGRRGRLAVPAGSPLQAPCPRRRRRAARRLPGFGLRLHGFVHQPACLARALVGCAVATGRRAAAGLAAADRAAADRAAADRAAADLAAADLRQGALELMKLSLQLVQGACDLPVHRG
ncbi:MAG: hypothetical protein E6F96_02415 [Actinobacteria bacterium]|nr:MAG: hypothetical protein E6F96_02415 [Actinomycetota bacterium]